MKKNIMRRAGATIALAGALALAGCAGAPTSSEEPEN